MRLKVITLTCGCMVFWKYFRGNPRRYENTIGDSRMKYQESAEVIVVIEYCKGLKVDVILQQVD